MSLIPAFQIGLWNAWILSLAFLLVTYVLSSLIVSKKAGLFVWPRYTRWEKVLNVILVVTMFSPFVYSIFVPLKLSTGWFYTGLAIYLIGMIFVSMTILSFAIAPVDKPLTRGGLSHFPKPYVLWLVPGVHRYGDCVCLLGFCCGRTSLQKHE